jgi:cytochrome c oxidase subunit 1
LFAGVYHWFPKMFGRMMNPRLGYIHFWLTFVGLYLVFFPQHFQGMGGVSRHYYAFTEFDFMSKFVELSKYITWAAWFTFVGQFFFLYNFVSSIFWGKKAPLNPWKANTLEWTTPRIPEHGNWPGEIPTVYRWPYDYSKPGLKDDFCPQHIPDEELEYEEGFQPPKPVQPRKPETAGSTEKVEE